MAKQPNLTTPGGVISAARRAQEMSLSELSALTKIPEPVIEALERDEYQRVSGALYIKSFLRACAVELGEDVENVLALYANYSGEGQIESSMALGAEDEVVISRIGLPWLRVAVIGGGLLLVGLALLLLLRRGARPDAVGGNDQQSPNSAVETGGAAPDSFVVGAGETIEPGKTGGVVETTTARLGDAPEPALEPSPAVLPEALPGTEALDFMGDKHYPVVLRVVATGPVSIQVKSDARSRFASAVWPQAAEPSPVLPDTGVVMGLVYRVRQGAVVYWGAKDHFSLRLESTAGVAVTLNGHDRDVRNLRAGGEMLLDLAGDR